MGADAVQTVGVIGLGSMGLSISQTLIGAGFAVAGYDIDTQATERLAGFGGKITGLDLPGLEQPA